ncbi:hypothetical protein FSP39_019201 [Pinctada imbricata]|uniref:Methyltransferase FkbM domain-containing protein n=1 Tax=Pinctada imbricata TaxID=66713 RepID=A0AA88XHX1_PINIB|nr:hypothetical protein FSP39_019201 [Pinctada imbricata]
MANIQLYHALFFVFIGFIFGWTIAVVTILDMKCLNITFPMEMFEYRDQISGARFNEIQADYSEESHVRKVFFNSSFVKNMSTQNSSRTRHSTKPVIRLRDKLNVYYFNNDSWTNSSNLIEDFNTSSFIKTNLHTTAGGTPIYIHDPKEDEWISRLLLQSNAWEWSNVNLMIDFIKRHRHSAFLDIGANLGVFSLSVAKHNRKVIAVEPLKSNSDRLCASILDGKLTNLITMIRNPMSDLHENVTLATAKKNIGGTFVVHSKAEADNERLVHHSGTSLQTVTLDDLLQLPGFNVSSVVMKIDVEGFESRVLRGGENFFRRVKVMAVLMEWMKQKKAKHIKDAEYIIDFMTRHGLQPTNPFIWATKLNLKLFNQWPKDILWRRL